MVPTALALKEICLADGEFQIATRYWTGGIRIEIGASVTGVTIVNGVTVAKIPERAENVITLFGPDTAWDKIRQAIPPRFHNDVFIATARGGISWAGDLLHFAMTTTSLEKHEVETIGFLARY